MENSPLQFYKMIAPQIKRYAGAFGRSLSTLEFYLGDTKEIVIVGEKGNELEIAVWENYHPNKIVVLTENPSENSAFIPLIEMKEKIDGKPTAFVCRNFVCQKPVSIIEELRKQLG